MMLSILTTKYRPKELFNGIHRFWWERFHFSKNFFVFCFDTKTHLYSIFNKKSHGNLSNFISEIYFLIETFLTWCTLQGQPTTQLTEIDCYYIFLVLGYFAQFLAWPLASIVWRPGRSLVGPSPEAEWGFDWRFQFHFLKEKKRQSLAIFSIIVPFLKIDRISL